jgi:hypothetical protein
MTIVSIEARAAEFLSMHKHDLARVLAKAEAELKLAGHNVEALFEDAQPAEMVEVSPAAPVEKLDLETLEPIPQPPPIDNDHVAEGAEPFAPDVIEGADAAPAEDAPQ